MRGDRFVKSGFFVSDRGDRIIDKTLAYIPERGMRTRKSDSPSVVSAIATRRGK
jgi:hypothetical protein